ncbi:MAG: sulfate permease, partial [Vallitaleaceae bacterium]|nr:sulfate permease [Vallitaleaceae bacterium]
MVFVPKLFQCLKTYTRAKLVRDVTAGIIVAIIALPLSIALAIASGVSPEKGLITAIIGGFVASFLGGSRVQISGPTGAFVVIVLNIIQVYGLQGLITATFMAGIILMIMGFAQMGNLIKFIPYPITSGFTCGIAIIIFTTQVKDFFGLNIEELPSEFIPKWASYIEHFNAMNVISLLIGLATILIIIVWPKFVKKIPGTLIAIVLMTVLTAVFHLKIDTIGSVYTNIQGSIPAPRFPNISFEMIKELIGPAFVIAFLGSIESLLSAVVADGMIGSTHKSNMELVGQGAANIASSLFGGIPVTGAIARTAANVKNGSRTPVSGMVHSVVLFLMMVFLMPYVKYIPMTALAGILMVVAYNMGEWEEFKTLLKAPKSDSIVFLSTFALTILFDLVFAIEVGMVMAAFLFMKRMSDVAQISVNSPDEPDTPDGFRLPDIDYNKSKVLIYEINGPFFFGAADNFLKTFKTLETNPKVLILEMSHVPAMDSTGYMAMNRLFNMCKQSNIKMMLVGLREQPYKTLEKYDFLSKIGSQRIYRQLQEAIADSNHYLMSLP